MGWEGPGRFKREGMCISLWPISVSVWQRSTQYIVKQLSPNLKINKMSKKVKVGSPAVSTLKNILQFCMIG